MGAPSDDLTVRITTHPATIWFIRNVASRLDPWVFRATNGRFFSMGKPDMPMVTLLTRGRRSGRIRPVHLASIQHEGHAHVVASAMGQERHPGWRYNLEAHPEVEVQAAGERYTARAEVLTDAEKSAMWDLVCALIPQIRIYEQRTDRNIRLFRLRRVAPESDRAAGVGAA
ncbi:MAG: nitroreductase family deazaflavin-dependent oxidoreductase [Myxococcota bacterium]